MPAEFRFTNNGLGSFVSGEMRRFPSLCEGILPFFCKKRAARRASRLAPCRQEPSSVDVETDVERAHGMREPAERNGIHAGFRDLTDVRGRDAAGGLRVAAAADDRDGLAEELGIHVVE